jgi:large subunit ribosomal protein L15
MKGQKARSGGSIRPGFEGGRMPLIRQLPKIRGFRSIHPKALTLSLHNLEKIFADGSVIDANQLQTRGIIAKANTTLKIVGNKAISKKFEFKGLKLSAGARLAVEKAGGKITDVQ